MLGLNYNKTETIRGDVFSQISRLMLKELLFLLSEYKQKKNFDCFFRLAVNWFREFAICDASTHILLGEESNQNAIFLFLFLFAC